MEDFKKQLDDFIIDNVDFYHVKTSNFSESELYDLDKLLDEDKFMDIMTHILNKNPNLFEKVLRKVRKEKLKKLK